jgi:hypothetical protein
MVTASHQPSGRHGTLACLPHPLTRCTAWRFPQYRSVVAPTSRSRRPLPMLAPRSRSAAATLRRPQSLALCTGPVLTTTPSASAYNQWPGAIQQPPM